MAIPNQDLKVCSKCKEAKPLKDFYRSGYKPGHAVRRQSLFSDFTAACRTCTRAIVRANYKVNRLEILAKSKIYMIDLRARVRAAAFTAYGGYKCVCCGETEKLFLTLDHVNNDGAKWRRETLGKRTAAGYHTYIRLLKHGLPDIMQVLCMNCQHGKRMNKGVCPHQVRCNDQS